MTEQKTKRIRFRYNLTQCYLEMARCAFTGVYAGTRKPLTAGGLRRNKNRVAGILFAMTSLTIIYSFLAVEAFVNYQLYQIWRRRSSKGELSVIRFHERFGEVARFQDLRYSDVRELGERVKTLCYLLGYAKFHDKHPRLWQQFRNLLEHARHFLVHPFPDPQRVQSTLETILTRTATGTYVSAAEGVIGHFYSEGHLASPSWLHANQLMRLKGVELLPQPRKPAPSSQRLERIAAQAGCFRSRGRTPAT